MRQNDVGNLLLSGLCTADFALLQPSLERVPLEIGDDIARHGEPIESVCFPEGSVIAFLTGVEPKSCAAVGLVGYEGMIGITALQGEARWTYDMVVRAQEGSAIKMDAGRLVEACDRSATLLAYLLRFAGNFFQQVARTSVTNMTAPLEQRLARWILLYHDRVNGDSFELTHKELGLMLGIRRASATDILHVLEGQGMIRNHRGLVEIRDREKLEACAGVGYGDCERDYRARLGAFGKGRGAAPAGQ